MKRAAVEHVIEMPMYLLVLSGLQGMEVDV
jgi:hypothetical protein